MSNIQSARFGVILKYNLYVFNKYINFYIYFS